MVRAENAKLDTQILSVLKRYKNGATRDVVQSQLTKKGVVAEPKKVLNRLTYLVKAGTVTKPGKGSNVWLASPTAPSVAKAAPKTAAK